jgi:hypothetical protein
MHKLIVENIKKKNLHYQTNLNSPKQKTFPFSLSLLACDRTTTTGSLTGKALTAPPLASHHRTPTFSLSARPHYLSLSLSLCSADFQNPFTGFEERRH